MPGSAQQGEWLVVCSVNGTKNIFVPQLGLQQTSENEFAEHTAGFDESCFGSLGSTAFAKAHSTPLFFASSVQVYFNEGLNQDTLRSDYPPFSIRGPPVAIS